jgi:hypothetical protein
VNRSRRSPQGCKKRVRRRRWWRLADWPLSVLHTSSREREPYMHMEEPLYRLQPAGASVCVIIENIGREKTLRERRERKKCVHHIYI